MIVKNLKIRKKRHSNMGQIISKEKKQKREALLPQMKTKTEAAPGSPAKKPPSPSSSSPPPPPRSLAATLASAALSAEFLAYLQKLDTAAGGGADREHTLQFVIKVRTKYSYSYALCYYVTNHKSLWPSQMDFEKESN